VQAGLALAHDPAECQQFAGKIMRRFITSERDRALSRYPLSGSAFADRAPEPKSAAKVIAPQYSRSADAGMAFRMRLAMGIGELPWRLSQCTITT
jgi:hypothetical protein